MRVVELQGVTNVRDLGGIPVEGGRVVAPGLLYRGGALCDATEEDRQVLFSDLGIRCVVDLRCGWELDDKPDVQVPGVENLHIPFYDLDIVGIEYTDSVEGTRMVGHDVACEPERFYRSLSNPLTVGQMNKALHTIFEHACKGVPVYQHCSGGKDRSGVMTLLILTVLGVGRDAIEQDYLFTNVARDKNYDKMYARFLRLADGDEKLARELVQSHRARTENLDAFYDAIDETYGGMESFVRVQLGFGDAAIASARAACTVERPLEEDVA